MRSAVVLRSTACRVVVADADFMFVHMIVVGVVHVPVVKIIDVIIVPHRGVAAVRTVHVWMLLVNFMIDAHF